MIASGDEENASIGLLGTIRKRKKIPIIYEKLLNFSFSDGKYNPLSYGFGIFARFSSPLLPEMCTIYAEGRGPKKM